MLLHVNVTIDGRLEGCVMKKVLVFVLCICLAVSFTACSCSLGGVGDASKNLTSNMGSSALQNSLDINDFVWNVDLAKISGKEVYALNLTNNSKYELLGCQIDYKVKDGVTPEQLSVYNDFMTKHASYIKDGQTTNDIILRGFDEAYIPAKGGTVSNIPLAIGIDDKTWREPPSKEQYELMEPKELMVCVVGSDDKLYMAYYDIKDQTWKIDANTVELNKWPDMEIAKLVPELKDHTFKSSKYESLNSCTIDAYGVSEEEYKAYIEKVKEKGFTQDIDEDNYKTSSSWEAKDANGNEVEIKYYKDIQKLSIKIEGKK